MKEKTLLTIQKEVGLHAWQFIELDKFMDNPFVHFLPVTYSTARRFARIASSLRHKGKPLPANDIWIAAAALETGAELITFDAQFQHVDGLVLHSPAE